ncbi:nitrite reductase small subunit NirD [Myceligenerans pegani]|uniref:Nitrite reductase small subunit NirD n=1 Tax=Myceligenerans pegani TaxID=2776917 RepID=A0ABR9MZY2_9MICO|nr:nitrite reductase small subunit NirD [Myceligenerans sp. TRM 65318]MBE1876965.1 nitrite reductase small subunit NirD [Myceligenerans sp. TRM 65318]MBE3019236.1 nitrite reductase small subunit NirD [Myceligenerans sp. TRM 65318]
MTVSRRETVSGRDESPAAPAPGGAVALADLPGGGEAVSGDVVWHAVCPVDDLMPERGVAALLDGVQVAVFLLAEPYDGVRVRAVQNLDPFSGAYVLSRGIVGTRDGVPTVASPIYKQVFSLVTGECLVKADKEPKAGLAADLTVLPARVRDGVVEVGTPA